MTKESLHKQGEERRRSDCQSQEHSERRTTAWLRKEAAARGLRPGRKVMVERWVQTSDGGRAKRMQRMAVVSGIYPYIFVCEIDGVAECFRYNQLIGNETGEKVILNG